MSSYTPGPWVWVGGERIGARGCTVAHVIPQASADANASLIAAAPTLLEALQEAFQFLDGTFGHANAPHDAGGLALLNNVRSAIAQAEGES